MPGPRAGDALSMVPWLVFSTSSRLAAAWGEWLMPGATSSAGGPSVQAMPPPQTTGGVQELFIEGQPEDHICNGYDEAWGNCEGLPECGPCVPANCVWGPWGEWHYAGGCIGLNFRERTIRSRANECGTPCTGAREESQRFVRPECKPQGADCMLSAWTEWSPCREEKDQSIRTREIQQPPGNGGAPCDRSLQETKPCGGPKKVDCQLGQWQPWTSCSAPCGEGRHTRMRRLEHDAENGGRACRDGILQTAPCMEKPCPGQDCALSSWSEWTRCDDDHTQRYRRRQILQAPKGAGKPCATRLQETLGCPRPEPVDCAVSSWTEWNECDRTCGGGQQFRERKVTSPAINGGGCRLIALKDTASCNTVPCFAPQPQDCELGTWNAWSQCSATCGEGAKRRTRKVVSFATFGGEGCKGSLEQLAICRAGDCKMADCLWSEWEEWSSCSVSCGGGDKHRTRQIAVSPTNGGAPCDPKGKGEVAPCRVEPCGEDCIDGTWGSWREWTQCSGPCRTAYKSRRRNVDVQPNSCGKAPKGLREEFVQCTSLPSCTVDRDCQVSEWGEWSHCSCHCFGVRERNRYIAEFASGSGSPCNHGLKQIEPCNPGMGQQTPSDCADRPQEDCIMGEWTIWSTCSVTCGGGHRERSRSVLQPSQHGGTPCDSDLLVTEPCGTEPCKSSSSCQDCLWGKWSEWSACSKCGGQKYRHRSIERMPNRCGKRCDLKTAKEVTECPNNCDQIRYCAWTEWSEGQCGGCGNSTTMRNRALGLRTVADDYLFMGTEETKCAGTQLDQSLCPFTKPCGTCVPLPCTFGDWSDWTAPSCQGLCERNRVIKEMNNECGEPCSGSLLETKRCPTVACGHVKDCILSEWGEWSVCSHNDHSGQRYRGKIVVQRPSHGGTPCTGPLKETTGCNQTAPHSCSFGEWREWGACSMSCGIGWHTRAREILQPHSMGGFPCEGKLKEVQHCVSGDDSACAGGGRTNCELGDWQEWSACGPDGQRYRDREIAQLAAHGGTACAGSVHETETCDLKKVDCRYSAWTEWDQCDRECGKGQTHRQRQIHRFPENGGKTCPHELMQTQGCELKPCVVRNCAVSSWAQWSACNKACGPGMQTRVRSVEHLRDPGGRGCTDVLGEARECLDNPPCQSTDCEWGDWDAWSGCSCTCGGGQRVRSRRIKSFPQKGGQSCVAEDPKVEEPCNTQPCGDQRCVDGAWDDWGPWSPCSASCDGGTTLRKRRIGRMANECGVPPHGKDSEVAFCNVHSPCGESVDCELSDWTPWNSCSKTCDGITSRTRQIKDYGRGNGAWCMGSLMQTWPCNPSPGQDPPAGCSDGPRRDCVLGDWREWSLCSATCGGGQHIRSRKIEQHPTNGGKGCDDALSEIKECARGECGGPAPSDCKFGEWEDWGECDKCSGERRRFRSILAYPSNGGKECDPTVTVELGKCPRRCNHQKLCEWDDWGAWSGCTVNCGKGGKRRRRRYLHLTEAGQEMLPEHLAEVMRGYESLRERATALEAHHAHEVLISFVAGCATILGALGGLRAWSTTRGRHARHNPFFRAFSARDASRNAEGRGYQHLQEVQEANLPRAAVAFEVE